MSPKTIGAERRSRLALLLIAAAVVAIAVFTCAGCSSEAPGEVREAEATVQEAPEFPVVENVDVAGVESGWSIPAEPIFRIGWEEGDPPLQSVRSGFIGSDRVVVGDGGANLIHILSLMGARLATVGGEGEGPGEFARLSGVIGLTADTFLVSDMRNQRASVFADTTLVREIRLEVRAERARYRPSGRLADGSLLLVPAIYVFIAQDPATGWQSYPLLKTVDFVEVDTLILMPMVDRRGPDDRNPLSHGGTAVSAGGEIAAAHNHRPQITWINAEGITSRVAVWDAAPRAATDEDRDVWERAYRDRTSARAGDPGYEESLRAMLRDFGGTIPLFGSVHGDSRGNVWLEEYDLAEPTPRRFNVVSSSGEWLGLVELPRPMRILDVTDDRILAVETDDFDVQAVALYAIEK